MTITLETVSYYSNKNSGVKPVESNTSFSKVLAFLMTTSAPFGFICLSNRNKIRKPLEAMYSKSLHSMTTRSRSFS